MLLFLTVFNIFVPVSSLFVFVDVIISLYNMCELQDLQSLGGTIHKKN